MKIRNGRPTKVAITELIDRHGLITNSLDSWARMGVIAYGGRPGADEKAAKLVDELRASGFEVEHSLSRREVGLNGIVRVKKVAGDQT